MYTKMKISYWCFLPYQSNHIGKNVPYSDMISEFDMITESAHRR